MKHLFFVYWTRAREKYIADKIDFERMISALGLGDSFKILQDTDYATFALSGDKSDWESVFEKERESARKELEKMGMDSDVAEFLFLKDDFSVLRSVLKEEKDDVADEKIKEIKKKYANEIKAIMEANLNEGELKDRKITLLFFEKMIDMAEKLKETEIAVFLKRQKDALIEIALLMEGGAQGEAEEKEREMIENEKKFFLEFGKKVSGLSPLFAYFFRRWEAEKILRIILSAKETGVPSDRIWSLVDNIRVL